jgi:hypothetical protein
VRTPGIDAETALAPNPLEVVLVENFKRQTETCLKFLLPLQEHGWRTGHHDLAHLLAQQQLAGNESCFDGFPEADIIRDEEVDARQHQGFAERFELVGIQANTSAEGGLE